MTTSNSERDAIVSFVRKPVYFDITPHWLNPELCKRDMESMVWKLKNEYGGRYIFTHEKELAKDARGNAAILRRHYLVDVLAEKGNKVER